MKKPSTSEPRLKLPASPGMGYWMGAHFNFFLTYNEVTFLYFLLYSSAFKLFPGYSFGGMHDC
jgi:hypothetical protein